MPTATLTPNGILVPFVVTLVDPITKEETRLTEEQVIQKINDLQEQIKELKIEIYDLNETLSDLDSK